MNTEEIASRIFELLGKARRIDDQINLLIEQYVGIQPEKGELVKQCDYESAAKLKRAEDFIVDQIEVRLLSLDKKFDFKDFKYDKSSFKKGLMKFHFYLSPQ